MSDETRVDREALLANLLSAVREITCTLDHPEGWTLGWHEAIELDKAERAFLALPAPHAQGGTETPLVQVGWYGPYGIIPGGMDNEPHPKWHPIYVRALLAAAPAPTEAGDE